MIGGSGKKGGAWVVMGLEGTTWFERLVMWYVGGWRRALSLRSLWRSLIIDPVGCGGQLGQGLTRSDGPVARGVRLHDGTDGATLRGVGSRDGFLRVGR